VNKRIIETKSRVGLARLPFCEHLVKNILPVLKISLARSLHSQGMTQSKIADRIGVSQAAVNYYLKKTNQFTEDRIRSLGLSRAEIDNYVGDLSKVLTNLSEFPSSCPLCGYEPPERVVFPATENPQCFCVPALGTSKIDGTRNTILSNIERAVSLLSSSENFPRIMPEVSVNIVMALPRPKNELDVASIPGRIVKVRGRAKVLARPEFGVSNHMARVLLAAVSYSSEIRAAMNIAYNTDVEKAIKHLRLRVIRNKRRTEEDGMGRDSTGGDVVLDSVRESFSRVRGKIDAVIDEGGFGLEPNVYLFGSDAAEVAQIALRISDYSASF
jgi:predicted fused transcriptional regulator/phosphomethylpyrimidine kinase/predicted transcriptional regulator